MHDNLLDFCSSCSVQVSFRFRIEFDYDWSRRRKKKGECIHRRCRLRNRFPNSRFLLDIACCLDSSSTALHYPPVGVKTLIHQQYNANFVILYCCFIYSTRILARSCGTDKMVHDSSWSSAAKISSAIFLRFDLKWNFLQRFRSRSTCINSFQKDKDADAWYVSAYFEILSLYNCTYHLWYFPIRWPLLLFLRGWLLRRRIDKQVKCY